MSTILKVVDNSGAKKVTCIYAIFEGKERGKFCELPCSVAAVMGVRSSFDDNAAVIADKQGQPKGSRRSYSGGFRFNVKKDGARHALRRFAFSKGLMEFRNEQNTPVSHGKNTTWNASVTSDNPAL
ncbi:hypothetical protein DKX38_004311 [Salix brachista]|uniref:Uncharacterized protein n=1 Tax=Salix brachista TaxID=2182728 RepID=A0A5N5NB53_9ROSI|nr:hypothetical protein DKX38_004311 [Salix brachista]